MTLTRQCAIVPVLRLAAITALALVLAPSQSGAQTSDQLASCVMIEDDMVRLKCFDAVMAETRPKELEAAQDRLSDLKEAQDRLSDLEAEKARLSEFLGHRHPDILKINADIERARAAVERDQSR